MPAVTDKIILDSGRKYWVDFFFKLQLTYRKSSLYLSKFTTFCVVTLFSQHLAEGLGEKNWRKSRIDGEIIVENIQHFERNVKIWFKLNHLSSAVSSCYRKVYFVIFLTRKKRVIADWDSRAQASCNHTMAAKCSNWPSTRIQEISHTENVYSSTAKK